MELVREALGLPDDVDGKGVTVAVIDSGIDADHPDLRGQWDQERSKSFITLDTRIQDQVGHGTHVAGIIAGTGALDARYRGIAPGVDLLIMRVFGSTGSGSNEDLAAAVDYARERGVDVINYSGGMPPWHQAGGPPPWVWSTKLSAGCRAVEAAASEGILIISAAGNAGPHLGSVERPANLEHVVAVGALDRDGEVSRGSARGPVYTNPLVPWNAVNRDFNEANRQRYIKPDLVVPGGGQFETQGPRWHQQLRNLGLFVGGIVSARSQNSPFHPLSADDPGRHYTRVSGTSQATAVCTGLAALALEYARRESLDFGGDPAKAVRVLFRLAARKSEEADSHAWGHGWVRWPDLRREIDHHASHPGRWRSQLESGQLRAL